MQLRKCKKSPSLAVSQFSVPNCHTYIATVWHHRNRLLSCYLTKRISRRGEDTLRSGFLTATKLGADPQQLDASCFPIATATTFRDKTGPQRVSNLPTFWSRVLRKTDVLSKVCTFGYLHVTFLSIFRLSIKTNTTALYHTWSYLATILLLLFTPTDAHVYAAHIHPMHGQAGQMGRVRLCGLGLFPAILGRSVEYYYTTGGLTHAR